MTIRAHRHFETTEPSVHPCRQCRRPVIAGLAEGIPARVDPTPISPADEAAVIASGRATFTLRRSGLIHRDPARRLDPTLASPLLASHAEVCAGRPPPQAFRSQQIPIDFPGGPR